MKNISDNNNRIAKNTFYLYIRMGITMLVGLYTSRVVLQALGASDFGLYNVVGGIVTMFSMVSGTLASGTQRFLTYALGEKNEQKLKNTFSIALSLHLLVVLVVLLLCETIGLWFLNTQMNIPEGRENAAFWVFQFSIIAFSVSVIQIPFMSCLIAHETMNMYAYMSIYDVAMKLLLVYLISIADCDKLILYAALILLINITSILIYNYYCRHRFTECKWELKWEKELASHIISFSGWNIFGSGVGFATGQGVNILLNIFCGTIVNAARGISVTISQYVIHFVNNFMVAVNPQLIKHYAAKEFEQMYRLTLNSCRISAYLFLLIAIPLGVEVRFVLDLWLGEYPEYTALFVQIILVQAFLNSIDRPLITHLHASGKMKMPNLTGGLALLLVLPISYLLLKLGFSPVSVCWASALIWIVDNINAIYWANKYTGIPLKLICFDIYGNVIIGAIVMLMVPFFVSTTMEGGLFRFLVVCASSVSLSSLVIYYWGMTPGMKKMVVEKIHLKK